MIILKRTDDLLTRIKAKTWLSGKYGKRGIKFYEYINGESDLKKICTKSNIMEKEGAEIVEYLLSIKAIDIKQEAEKEKPNTEFETEKTKEKEKNVKIAEPEEPKKIEETPEEQTDSTEKEIFKLFGEDGITVFNLIDGKRTIKQIIAESGIPKEKVIKIIKKINEIGVIKL